MTKNYIHWVLFSAATLLAPLHLNATAVVLGTMKNAYLNDRIELKVPHYFVDGKSSAPVTFIDGAQKFTLSVDLQEPQLLFLVHNEDRLPIFLEPNDTLVLSTDMFQFPLSVTFSGKAGHNNRLLQMFLKENPQDFNEFNNLRYKIGYWWTTVESNMDRFMDELNVADFRTLVDKKKTAGFGLVDDYMTQNPGTISKACQDYLNAEILYDWAYHLLFYGNIYKVKHAIEPAFFEFLYDAPANNEAVGSDAYRRFLMTLMAYKIAPTSSTAIYADQYLMSNDFLSGKALAFFRSEILLMGMKAEKYGEVLPYYKSFLQNNLFHEYETKITDLYEKAVRVSPGTVAPAFAGRDWFGNDLSLTQYKGKVVYLNFWASWCASCIKKMNYLDDYAASLENDGIVLINVSLDEDVRQWNQRIGEEQFKGQHILATAPVANGGRNIAEAYQVQAVPQYFLIDKNGRFAEKGWSNAPDDIRNRLLELAKGKQ